MPGPPSAVESMNSRKPDILGRGISGRQETCLTSITCTAATWLTRKAPNINIHTK